MTHGFLHSGERLLQTRLNIHEPLSHSICLTHDLYIDDERHEIYTTWLISLKQPESMAATFTYNFNTAVYKGTSTINTG
jgi:hypothetical protein